MNKTEAIETIRQYLPPGLAMQVFEALDPEPQPGQPMQVQRAHAGYILKRWPHRSMMVSAQDLRDIYDWCLLHMQELEVES